MKENMICFTLGLSFEDIQKGQAAYDALDQDKPELSIVALTDAMLSAPVGETLDRLEANPETTGVSPKDPSGRSPLINPHPYRVVMVNTPEREQVLRVMRSFKAVLPEPRNLIFAVITDTARTWTFSDYIGHLAEEHQSFQK